MAGVARIAINIFKNIRKILENAHHVILTETGDMPVKFKSNQAKNMYHVINLRKKENDQKTGKMEKLEGILKFPIHRQKQQSFRIDES